jgi:GTP cyclohydrolase III
MRLQRKLHDNTLKKNCYVSASQTKTDVTRMSAVIMLRASLTTYKAITFILNGDDLLLLLPTNFIRPSIGKCK